MSPEYFMRTLTFYEAEAYVEGLYRRRHPWWEIARYIGFYAAAPHCKNFSLAAMGQFPWEKEYEEPVDEEEERRELEALRRRIAERDAMTNTERMDKKLSNI